MVHFELNFVKGVNSVTSFIVLCMEITVVSETLIKKNSLSSLLSFSLSSKILGLFRDICSGPLTSNCLGTVALY